MDLPYSISIGNGITKYANISVRFIRYYLKMINLNKTVNEKHTSLSVNTIVGIFILQGASL